MFQQILYVQWKSVRLGLLPMVIASFGLPLLAVQGLAAPSGIASEASAQAEQIFGAWQIWLPVFPSLALVIGVVLALNAWNWDHRAGHVYALSLPLPRWEYVLLKMGAGALLLLLPVLAMGIGSVIAAGALDLPNGLHAYPAAFTARFLMASALIYGILFAMAAGTIRTTVIIIFTGLFVIFGGGLATAFLSDISPNFDWNLADWLIRIFTEWPGPFEVFFGNWNLIDV